MLGLALIHIGKRDHMRYDDIKTKKTFRRVYCYGIYCNSDLTILDIIRVRADTKDLCAK